MIIKLTNEEWNNDKRILRKEVKRRLNGETPDNLIIETKKVGEEIEINLKL